MSFAVFWRSSLLLRVGLCDKFSGANFCFCSLFGSLCFWCGFAYGFCVFSCNFALEALSKIFLDVRSCFLSRSLCLRVWVDDVFVVSLLLLFSLKR